MNREELIRCAWSARESAYAWKSGTKVGCAILTDKDDTVCGWNIEGLWMTSLHAEVVAITHLVMMKQKIKAMAVVAETKMFTPCGACLDWIYQFSIEHTQIIIDNKRETKVFMLNNLMPFYPIQ